MKRYKLLHLPSGQYIGATDYEMDRSCYYLCGAQDFTRISKHVTIQIIFDSKIRLMRNILDDISIDLGYMPRAREFTWIEVEE